MTIFKPRPLVSIVMASYNHAPFVEQAILTALNQDIDNIELIVVDDGSTDGTADIVGKIKDKRIRLIRLSENRKVHPRNLALNMAKGRYIAFQNSDDIWKPKKLAVQLKEFDRNKNLAVCFTGVSFINKDSLPSNGKWLKDSFTVTNRPRINWLRYMFDQGNCFCISSALVKRKAIKKVGNFNESLVQLSDLDVWVGLAAIGDFYIVNESLTKMRIVNKSNVSYPSDEAIRRSAIEFAHVLKRYSELPIIKDLDKIFAETISNNNSEILKLVTLVRYAWTKSPSHYFFADSLFSKLLDKPGGRHLITNRFGTEIINEFIKRRGQMEIIVNE